MGSVSISTEQWSEGPQEAWQQCVGGTGGRPSRGSHGGPAWTRALTLPSPGQQRRVCLCQELGVKWILWWLGFVCLYVIAGNLREEPGVRVWLCVCVCLCMCVNSALDDVSPFCNLKRYDMLFFYPLLALSVFTLPYEQSQWLLFTPLLIIPTDTSFYNL